MALEKKKFTSIPADAVILSEDQAIIYQAKILQNWNVASDVFSFKYGSYFLGGATMLTGMYFNSYFRWKFKLRHYGRFVSYLPMAGVPAAITMLFHQQVVLRELMLMKQNECPVCLQSRAAALQAGIGCVFPLVLAPITSLTLVNRYNTFDLPYISREPLKVLKVLQKIMKPKMNTFFGIFVAQAFLASVVTYLEADSIYRVNSKLLQLTEDAENIE